MQVKNLKLILDISIAMFSSISMCGEWNLQVMLAMAESAVTWRSAAILLATKSGHEVPLASAVKAIT